MIPSLFEATVESSVLATVRNTACTHLFAHDGKAVLGQAFILLQFTSVYINGKQEVGRARRCFHSGTMAGAVVTTPFPQHCLVFKVQVLSSATYLPHSEGSDMEEQTDATLMGTTEETNAWSNLPFDKVLSDRCS